MQEKPQARLQTREDPQLAVPLLLPEEKKRTRLFQFRHQTVRHVTNAGQRIRFCQSLHSTKKLPIPEEICLLPPPSVSPDFTEKMLHSRSRCGRPRHPF